MTNIYFFSNLSCINSIRKTLLLEILCYISVKNKTYYLNLKKCTMRKPAFCMFSCTSSVVMMQGFSCTKACCKVLFLLLLFFVVFLNAKRRYSIPRRLHLKMRTTALAINSLTGNAYMKFIRAASCENQHFAYAKTKTQISFAAIAKLISAFVFAT